MCFTKMDSPRTVIKLLLLGAVVGALVSCKEGVKSGSVQQDFSGIGTVDILSPTAVKVNWTNNDKYNEYQVYGDFQTEPLATRIFENAVIEQLSPATKYSFKVLGVAGEVTSGGNREVVATTWPRFTGPTKIEEDVDGNLVVSWEYPYPIVEFQIFYRKQQDPTSSSTGGWLTPDLVTNAQQAIFKNLDGSTRYHFVVHAKYREGEVERPTTSVNATTGSSFPTPTYFLSPISIGSIPFAQITPVINSLFLEPYYTTQVFRDGSPASDPLVGQGTLVFSGSVAAEPGPVDKISIQVNYNDGNINETLIFDNLSTYVKGMASYLDTPPVTTTGGGEAFLGEAMASGDFNCDGYKDLAIGMPQASIGSLGVSNRRAGAIYIYYSYRKPDLTYELFTGVAPAVEPVERGKDPQVITFDDLGADDLFGFSLSGSGNLNGDKLGLNECQDLVVGAPYMDSGAPSNGSEGTAFVFFGSRNGLTSPAHISDFPNNVETCDGLVEEASCTAVRLWSDFSLWPSAALGGAYGSGFVPNTGGVDEFGYSVSFIGDFNADGYDDIAIGAPSDDWDGEMLPGAPNGSGYVTNVGSVYIFFGSRYGLGMETPMATGIPSGSDFKFRFLKVLPPVPESGMRFGHSVAGGADVDGGYRVKGTDYKLHGGSDLLVGAPRFSYQDPDSGLLPILGGSPDDVKGIIPANGGWKAGSSNYTDGTSHYGINQNSNNSTTGVAFLYFGRTFGYVSPPNPGTNTTNMEEPSRSNFWNCGRRGLPSETIHYTCLASDSSFRLLSPRDGTSIGFGNSVALLGNKARFKEDNTNADEFIDPNTDGYAEVAVVASSGDSAISTNTGVIWQYFGNRYGRFESNDFYNLGILSQPTPAGDYYVNTPSCTNFNIDNVATRKACAPTVIRPNSIAANANMGIFPESVDVGDVTGDGVIDLVVGAPYDTTMGTESGAIFAFTSTPGMGLTSNYKKIFDNQGDSYDRLGSAVAVGNFDGDFNGSSRPLMDVAAGAPQDEEDRPGGGSTQVYLTGGLALPAIKQDAGIRLYDSLATLQDFGYENSRIVGDVNGDGYGDAVTHVKRQDATGGPTFDAVIYFGSPYGLVTTSYCLSHLDKVFKSGLEDASECYPQAHASGLTQDSVVLPQLIPKPNNQSGYWAQYSFPAGDVNGDGFADVVFVSNVAPRSVVAYYGTPGGLQSIVNPSWNPATNDPQIVTKSLTPGFTNNFTSSFIENIGVSDNRPIQYGDFNGDGYADLVISDPTAYGPSMNTDPGNPILPDPAHDPGVLVTPGSGWLCDPLPQNAADCAAGSALNFHGAVYIVFGSSSGYQTPSLKATHPTGTDFDLADTSMVINGYGTEAGPTKPCTSGDPQVCLAIVLRNPIFVNLNYGYSRIDHRFGASTAVMDFDNDEIDDLIVSAPGFEDIKCWDDPSGPRDYGRLYLFKGSAQGLVASIETDYYEGYNAAQSCPLLDAVGVGDRALATATVSAGSNLPVRAIQPVISYPAESENSTRRLFGAQVGAAGDVNGDGFEDLLVSSPRDSLPSKASMGSAFIYYGPLCGADNDAGLTTFIQTTNNINKQKSFLDAGTVFGGDCLRPAGVKPAPQKIVVLDSVASDYYGTSISSARKGLGDVNKDGFDDIVMGSYHWDNAVSGQTDIGRGVIFFGGSMGLYADDFPGAAVVKNANGQVKPFAILPEWIGDGHQFFQVDFSGGDINGDGTMDLMVPSRWHDGEGANRGIDLGAFFMFY